MPSAEYGLEIERYGRDIREDIATGAAMLLDRARNYLIGLSNQGRPKKTTIDVLVSFSKNLV